MKKLLIILNMLSIGVLLTGSVKAAGSATLSLSPSNATHTVGDVFNTTIYENGSSVSVVTVKMSYDTSKLKCNSISTSGSAFVNSISASCGGGVAEVSRYIAAGASGLNGTQKVATVNFSTIASGMANVSFNSGSQVASNGTNLWNGASFAASYTINNPVTPDPTPTPTPDHDPAPSSGNTSKGNINKTSNSSSESDKQKSAKTDDNSDKKQQSSTDKAITEVKAQDTVSSMTSTTRDTKDYKTIGYLALTLAISGLIWLTRHINKHKNNIF